VHCRVIAVFGLFCQISTGQNLPSFDMAERWEHYLRRTYSWQRMGLLGADVGVDMVLSRPADGRSVHCYNDRYLGAFFRRSSRTTVELVAGAALHEDIRRRESGRKGFFPRLSYALSHTFTAYQPDGHSSVSWSRIIGAVGGIAVYETWNQRPITTGIVGRELSFAMASNFQDSLLMEFGPDMKRFGLRLKNRFMPRRQANASRDRGYTGP
jgi:hypothetical protein